ncbi:hypothetical protein HanOQP8_Chr03g0086701 [Helianthus annuus]|nr:hypothetical protein HanLR1_Chr03g0078121 [Helianthus annuus]KAJ0772381.1 hypothetical protein HanOQP8_Chr03g0086701 [Helianthus annuus]KAJ0941809.1 hypothetical protein HanPSC8_Chr03g0084481 [Helianthus annuus]
MNRLARRWRNHSDDNLNDVDENLSLPTSSGFQPIDTGELVRSLVRSQARQSRFWSRVFAALLCCFVAFLIFSIHGQTNIALGIGMLDDKTSLMYKYMSVLVVSSIPLRLEI